MKSAPGDSSQAIGEIGDGNAHMGNWLRNTLPRDAHSTEAKNQAADPAHALFFDRLVAISTSMNETAVISVLIAAIVGSISSRSAVNIRLVSG